MHLTPNERGEAVVEVGGQKYVMALDIHAMATAEDYVESTTGKFVDFDAIQAGAQRGRLRFVIALFYASLRKHHRDITPQRAGELVEQSMREQAALAAALGKASVDTVPDPADVAELRKGTKARPRKAQDDVAGGTGDSSNSTPVAAA